MSFCLGNNGVTGGVASAIGATFSPTLTSTCFVSSTSFGAFDAVCVSFLRASLARLRDLFAAAVSITENKDSRENMRTDISY